MSTTQEKNCCKECLICSNPQEYKINYVELHGVCSVHKTNSQNIQICKNVKAKFLIYSMKKYKILIEQSLKKKQINACFANQKLKTKNITVGIIFVTTA